jgi:hypothetical protein
MTVCRGESKEECRKKSLPNCRSILTSAEFIRTDLGLNLAAKCPSCDTVLNILLAAHVWNDSPVITHVQSCHVLLCDILNISWHAQRRFFSWHIPIVLRLINVFKGVPSCTIQLNVLLTVRYDINFMPVTNSIIHIMFITRQTQHRTIFTQF